MWRSSSGEKLRSHAVLTTHGERTRKMPESFQGDPVVRWDTANSARDRERKGKGRPTARHALLLACLGGEQRWVSVSLTETRVPINRSEVASNRGLETVALSKQGAAERFDGRKGRCAGQYGVMGSHSGVLLWTHQHFCIES